MRTSFALTGWFTFRNWWFCYYPTWICHQTCEDKNRRRKLEKLQARAQAKMSTVLDIQSLLQTQKTLRSLYLVGQGSKFDYQLTQVSRMQNVIESESGGDEDPYKVM
jgi:hypothetical protein